MTCYTAIFNGNSSGDRGGAVYNTKLFTLDTASFSGNIAKGNTYASGGAIGNDGTLTVSNADFRENSAEYSGGAIHNRGTAILNNVSFSGNSAKFGGAVCNEGEISLASATFSSPSDTIYNSEDGTIRFSGANRFAAEIVNFGKMKFEISTRMTCAIINDLGKFSGPGSCSLSLDSSLADGEYRIADHTGKFTGSLSLAFDGTTSGSLFTLSEGHITSGTMESGGRTCILETGTAEDSLILTLIRTLAVTPEPLEIISSPEKVAWTPFANTQSPEYVLEISPDRFFFSILTLRTPSAGFDLENLPDGNYHWRVRDQASGLYASQEESIFMKTDSAGGGYSVSAGNGVPDIFFAAKSGVWSNTFHARHAVTGEIAETAGMNRFQDVFAGSPSDTNILYLTDDENGDSLFQDDIYSAGAGAIRLDNIREIRAGAGGDVIDLTSEQIVSKFTGTILRGGAGNDILWAAATATNLFGDAGNDILRGGAGNDLLSGGADDDILSGGGGNDIIAFGGNWGKDIIEWNPTADDTLTLVFEKNFTFEWNGDHTLLASGGNSITFNGFTKDDVTILCGPTETGADKYEKLSSCGAFLESSSTKIYEDPDSLSKSMIACL